MSSLFLYLIKVTACSLLFYGYYLLALRNKRFHQWNRYYLLGATLLSAIIPLLHIPFVPDDSTRGGLITYTSRVLEVRDNWLPMVTITPERSFSVADYAAGAYVLGILLLLFRLVLGLRRMIRLIRQHEKIHFADYILVPSAGSSGPYSFFRYICWDTAVEEDSDEGRHMLRHELAHVREKHSADKLFMELACALFWCNPVFHLFRKELSLVHEFIADEKATGQEAPAAYAACILLQPFGHAPELFSNTFFHPPVKRRLRMLLRPSGNGRAYLRRLLVIPLLAVVAVLFSFTQYPGLQVTLTKVTGATSGNMLFPDEPAAAMPADTVPDAKKPAAQRVPPPPPPAPSQKSKTPPPPPPAPPRQKDSRGFDTSRNALYTFVQKMPEFPGGDKAMMNYLREHVRYPAEAREENIQGTIIVQFIVSPDGSLSNIKTIGAHKGGGLEEEAVRIVKTMPRWQPGIQDNKPVRVQYALPIRFMLQASGPARSAADSSRNGPAANKVYTFVEKMPAFPGGDEALMHYLRDHIHYPDVAREKNIQGTVVVQFIVGTDGSLSHVHTVEKPKGGGLEEEAIRVVQAMPRWQPGSQDGKLVVVQYSLPVRFLLQ
ncbi:TonB family protein [Compostibacter hankyongensis]|uniref:M56 family metallopeptidase n=1 Tax=Compostibacter hankyongensis TaxID=1007089 RepID=A0ABP8G9Q7_9BACT